MVVGATGAIGSVCARLLALASDELWLVSPETAKLLALKHEIELEKGVRLIASLEAVSEPDEKGMRTVMCTLNGQSRPVVVRDRSVVSNVKAAERADTSQPGQVAAPFAGAVTLTVKAGESVKAGDTVATIEAMKMEASITTPVAGTVSRLAVAAIEQVQGGDLLLVVE